jgi:type I restriction enzyme S subunit
MAMSDLPEGWTQACLGELAGEPEQYVPAAEDSFAYVDIGAIDRTRKSIQNAQQMLGKDAPSRARKKIAAGDTLVSMTRPNLNAVALVPDVLDGQIASTGFDVLRPKKGIDPRWLAYVVRTDQFVKAMSDLVQGALYPAVRPKDVRGYIAALAPAAEQTRIADQLDTLLARIQACNDRLDAIPALLKRFRRAVLNAATSGLLTEDWRNNEMTSWPQVRLAEVASGFSYGSAAKSSPTGEVPVLRMGNIQDGRLDWSDLVFTSDKGEIDKYTLTPGDVLFNRTNSPELVGKTAVYRGGRPAVYAGYLIRVRCSPSLLPDYLNYCLNSQHGRDYCWSVKADGISQSNINAKKLAAFPFRLPSLSEQAEVVRRVEVLLSVADRMVKRYEQARWLAQRLAPVTLSKAFRGELVSQDPNDEPASALMAGLKAAHTDAAAEPSRRRPKTPGKRPNMSIADKNTIKAAILKLKTDRFSFDELRAQVSGDYEQLKAALFELLEEPSPVVRQVFDEKTKAMQLVRV